jgi:hypothetical protein
MQSNLPAEFLPQLFARLFKEKSPKFYQIIRDNSLWFSVASILVPLFVTYWLPGFGVTVPAWLTFANSQVVAICTFLAGLGAGSAVVASTTIQGASPPLASDKPSTEEQLLAKLSAMQQEIDALKAGKS